MNIATVGTGFTAGNNCTTDMCKQFNEYVRARHLYSDPPGTSGAHGDGTINNPGNFAGTLQAVTGKTAAPPGTNAPYTPKCPVDMKAKDCDEQNPLDYTGIMPRSDSWQTKAKTAVDYKRNREPCIAMGKKDRELLRCMASRVPIN